MASGRNLAEPDQEVKPGRGDRERRERALDESIAGTFPASDPLSSNPDPLPEEDGSRPEAA